MANSSKRSHKTVEAPPMPTRRRIFPSDLITNPVQAIKAERSVFNSGLTYDQLEKMIFNGKAI